MRYLSLHDYTLVLRRYRIPITLLVIAGMVVGLAQSLSKPNLYRSTTVLDFRDLAEDLSLFGGDTSAIEPLIIRVQRAAERATGRTVTRRVIRRFKDELPSIALQSAVTTEVDSAQLVKLTAVWGDPRIAADIANEFADQIQIVESRDTEKQLKLKKESLQAEIAATTETFEPGIDAIRISTLEAQLSRIQTLLDVAQPVEVVERANPPVGRFSPNPTRDAVVGGLLGLAIAVAGAFTRVALDRRMRTAHDVHVELGSPVVGRIGQGAMGKPGLAATGAAAMWDTDFEAFRLLRTNLRYLESDRKITSIVCTSSLAGEGKSTVCMSLASAAALAGRRVLLVECDLRRPVFAKRFGLSEGPGLSDYLVGDADPGDVLQEVELSPPRISGKVLRGDHEGVVESTAKFVAITAGTPVQNPAELLLEDAVGSFIDAVSSAYDLVLIDTTPLLAVVDTLQLIPHCDAVLLCVKAHETTRDQVRATKAMLEHVPQRPLAAVVTGLRGDGSDTYEYYYGY